MFTRIWRTIYRLNPLPFLIAISGGTALGFLVSISGPLIKTAKELAKPYELPLPAHSVAEGSLIALSLAAIALALSLPSKLWRSLKLGLIPAQAGILFLSAALFWVAYDWHHPRVAWGSVLFATLTTLVLAAIRRGSSVTDRDPSQDVLESDLPVPEGGKDLLGRGDMIDDVVSKILLEQPTVLAVTGGYGHGKTSFLNLAVGELRKAQPEDLPVIAKFSPWLAPDSNTLVLSLLNSIVASIREEFVVPGLRSDAARFARTLLGVTPKADRLKELIAEPSQQERIEALVERICRLRRRVLVVLDDLDRLQADELETVLKLLRGSERLSNISFLCAFSPQELEEILRVSRPYQNTALFIEKFFPVRFELPKVDSAQLRALLVEKLKNIFRHYGTGADAELATAVEQTWDGQAALYFENLRRIKLFVNRVSQSLQKVASEVNTPGTSYAWR